MVLTTITVVVVVSGFFFLIMLLAVTMTDYGSREWLKVPARLQ
jgi:hypothetical protein